MISFYNLFLCIGIIFNGYNSVLAVRWPCAKIANTSQNILLSSQKKYCIRSSRNIKKIAIQEGMHSVFSSFLSEPLVYIPAQELNSLFLDSRKQSPIKVRVLLAKSDAHALVEWKFVSPQGFIIRREDSQKGISKPIKVSHLVVKIKRGCLFLNNKRIQHTVRIHSIQGPTEYNGTVYDGDFIIVPYQNIFLCINQIQLEDYVCAVLRTESWPGWPLEVNKAFAITCRSYVMFKLLEAQRSGRLYHVKNTNAHQTYRGRHEIPLLKRAVEETRGVVLGFNGKPILAMFDCCCGGVIPAYIEDFDFSKAPYLARTYACNYCKHSSLYSWQISYEYAAFESLLQQHLLDAIPLSDIHVLKKDKSGLVMQVKLKGPRNTTIISGKKLYSMMKEVKSFHFDIQKKATTILFKGRGFGHHLGLCQWGARQMVREGWDYKSILRFSYPGCYFMHLI